MKAKGQSLLGREAHNRIVMGLGEASPRGRHERPTHPRYCNCDTAEDRSTCPGRRILERLLARGGGGEPAVAWILRFHRTQTGSRSPTIFVAAQDALRDDPIIELGCDLPPFRADPREPFGVRMAFGEDDRVS